MKRIEEFGISPTPWDCHKQFVIAADGGSVVAATSVCDARLIAAAPKLYECLREAVAEMCDLTCEQTHSECAKTERECFVAKWRKALAEASGEEDKRVTFADLDCDPDGCAKCFDREDCAHFRDVTKTIGG